MEGTKSVQQRFCKLWAIYNALEIKLHKTAMFFVHVEEFKESLMDLPVCGEQISQVPSS